MQALTGILAVLAGTSAFLIKVPVAPILQPIQPRSTWIHLQKLVLPLFENVCEASTDPVINRLAQEFLSSLSSGDFWEPEVITKFQSLKSGKGFLPKGQIFSEYNVEHTNELQIMFDVMRNAKTFDTFYKVAAWSRQNLNCGLYVDLIYMALENRRDTEKLTLPPPYELLPNYFIRKDIIIQGSSLLAGEEFTPSEGVRDEGNSYTLDANYTANFYDNDDESKLAYFREDIGLNSYFFMKVLKWAPWSNKNVDINSRNGEEMYHMIKQLVSRYDLERYANGLPEQDELSWDSLSDAPYDPMLVYSNGNEFIHRTAPVQLPENEDKALLQTIESNIATVVSHMKDAGYNKTQILNHLMEILVTGERSYDSLARHLLGKALSNNGQPTIFEHYMTSLRDPMIWKMYKKIVALVDNSLKILPSYKRTELYFPGVEVVSIDVKKMMTNFENFEFDITEALKLGNGDTTFQVKIGQPRLNHKPFVMKLNISSLVTQKGLVKIYIGPKMLPGEFAKMKNMFNLLDSFELNLKRGSNIVTRTSSDMKMFAPDFTSLKTLSKRVEDAQFGIDSLPLNSLESQISFPDRLSIPKGTPDGLPLQLFVFVAPFMKVSAGGAYLTPSLEFNPAVLSPLYPLDLMMEDRILLDLPNALVKDLVVTQKGAFDAKKSYDKKSYGPPSRPNMYNNENEPFDYKNKNQKFGDDTTKFSKDEHLPSEVDYYYENEKNDDTFTRTSALKTSEYNYNTNKQPYDYKSTSSQYQKPDFASKRVDYKALYQNKKTDSTITTERPVEIEIQNIFSDKELENNKQVADKIQIENSNKENIFNVNQQLDDLTDNVSNDDLPSGVRHYYLLKSSGLNQKDTTDDVKFKRPKVIVPDYKKMYKNMWKTTENPVNKNKKTKLEIMNEELYENNDRVLSSIPKTENVKIFKIIKDDDKLDSTIKSINKDNFLLEDLGNVEILKVLHDKTNMDKSTDSKNDKFDLVKVIVDDVHSSENGNDIDKDKESSNEEIYKIVPVTEAPYPTTDSLYKYIMRILNHDSDENIS